MDLYPKKSIISKKARAGLLGILSVVLSCNALQAQVSERKKKPNVIVILVDDLGWADLGCYGNTYNQTPNIDRFAAEGMRFTDAYASSLCTPTRASIMTGKYPARTLNTNWNPAGRWDPKGRKLREARNVKTLALEETTLAEAVQKHGYTTALVGKWQLGGPPFGGPEQHGFDINKGGGDFGSSTYFYPYDGKWPIPTTDQVAEWNTFDTGKEGEYLTDRLTEESEKFIRNNRDNPFFLYLSHFAVHSPYQAKEEKIAKYAKVPEAERTGTPEYAAMLESVDESLGRVIKVLKELNLDEHTLILFTSDNGGTFYPTVNTPLRAWKGSEYEGGIRVPFMARWPGKIQAGSTSDEPIICNDIYPTVLDALDLPLLPHQHEDGLSLMPLLKGSQDTLDREALYWHNPHYNVHPQSAPVGVIRKGDWKLMEFYEDDHVELYNLAKDLGEQNDLAEKKPQKVAQLRNDLNTWRENVAALMMSPNPEFEYPTLGLYGAKIEPFYDTQGSLKLTMEKKYSSFSYYYTFDGTIPDRTSPLYSYGEEISVPKASEEIKVTTYQNKKPTSWIVTMSREEMEKRASNIE